MQYQAGVQALFLSTKFNKIFYTIYVYLLKESAKFIFLE